MELSKTLDSPRGDMSKTPRTDAQKVYLAFELDENGVFIKLVTAKFASELERELIEARHTVARLYDKLHGTPCEQIRHTQEVAQLREEITAMATKCDMYKTLWQRDSAALGVVIGERNTSRAIAEDNRARAANLANELSIANEKKTQTKSRRKGV